jgi:hypothetical protein
MIPALQYQLPQKRYRRNSLLRPYHESSGTTVFPRIHGLREITMIFLEIAKNTG